jgi:hypothetical protein
MAHQTEAACLLHTGATYARRLGLRPAAGGGDEVFAGFKQGACSLYFGDAPIVHFDLEGRWQRAYVEGVHYLKALDGSVVAIERVREGPNLVLHRRPLSFAAISDLDAQVRAWGLEVLDGLGSNGLRPVNPPPPARPIAPEELCAFLDRVAYWDASAWFAQRERVLAAYAPFGFLPPEAQHSVLLQATLGNADGLTFGLSAPTEHAVRMPAELKAHAHDVAELLGKRVLQCKSVFLGGADLLRLPVDQVAALLEIAAGVFPIDPSDERPSPRDRDDEISHLSGILAFLDRFEPPLPDRASWTRLRAGHLNRVALGIESGAPEVRSVYGKTWENGDLRKTVAALKAAEIDVSLILLVGAGGLENAASHVQSSAELLNDLPLGPGDLVYLVDAAEVGGLPARRRLEERGLTPVPPQELLDQRAQLLAQLSPLRSQRRAKVAPYSLEKQWA